MVQLLNGFESLPLSDTFKRRTLFDRPRLATHRRPTPAKTAQNGVLYPFRRPGAALLRLSCKDPRLGGANPGCQAFIVMLLTDSGPMLPRWRPACTTVLCTRRIVADSDAAALAALVRSRDSLTARLTALVDAPVQVCVRAQGAARARPDELRALGLPHGRLVWRREVVLRAQGEALIAARSVMALADCPLWVAGMGTKALGHQLFARRPRAPQKSAIRRSPIEVAWLRAPGAAPLLARRSTFTLDRRRRLLVQESLLPALIGRLVGTPAHEQPAVAAFG